MKNHLEKENVEFRYYEIPQGMPVLPLLGEKWITRYGADPMHFHNYLELGYCYSGKGDHASWRSTCTVSGGNR